MIEAQVQKLLDTKKANEEANYKAKPIRENIEFDDFMKLDIRVGGPCPRHIQRGRCRAGHTGQEGPKRR